MKISKPNVVILALLLVVNLPILLLSYFKHTYYFNNVFYKFNIVQLSIIYILLFSLFYWSYLKTIKKKPGLTILLAYILSLSIFIFTAVNLNITLEQLMYKASFSISNYLFINFIIIVFGLILSIYDFPLIENLKRSFNSFRESFYKNLGLILFIAFIISYIGLVNRTYIYGLSAIIIFINAYLFKALLSNLRK